MSHGNALTDCLGWPSFSLFIPLNLYLLQSWFWGSGPLVFAVKVKFLQFVMKFTFLAQECCFLDMWLFFVKLVPQAVWAQLEFFNLIQIHFIQFITLVIKVSSLAERAFQVLLIFCMFCGWPVFFLESHFHTSYSTQFLWLLFWKAIIIKLLFVLLPVSCFLSLVTFIINFI